MTDPTGKRIRRGIGHKSKVNRKTAKARRLELQANENREGFEAAAWSLWTTAVRAIGQPKCRVDAQDHGHALSGGQAFDRECIPTERVGDAALTPARANDVVASWRTLVGPATGQVTASRRPCSPTPSTRARFPSIHSHTYPARSQRQAQRERHVTIEDVTKVTQYLLEQKPKTAAGWEGFKTRAGVALMVQLGHWTGMRTGGKCQHTAGLLINGFQELDEDRYILYPRGEYETTKQKQRVTRIEPSLRLWWKQHGKYLQAMAKDH